MAQQPLDNVDTDQLVQDAQNGDKSAERQLMTRYRERLKRMIAALLGPRVASRIDPSDILQATLADAARRLPDRKDDRPGGFYPWLRQIAKDRIIDAHRQHIHAGKRTVLRENQNDSNFAATSAAHLVDLLTTSGPSPLSHVIANERKQLTTQALDRLPESDRELLLMRYVEQLSAAEIANVLSISEAAVKSRLWRAFERMNRMISRDQGDD